mgnify:CR=1 FL=1
MKPCAARVKPENTNRLHKSSGELPLKGQQRQMLKKQKPFELSEVKRALEQLASLSLQTPTVFEVNATDPKSEAKQNIWDEFDEFTKLSDDLAESTSELAMLVEDIDDLRPTLMKVSEGCKACHSKYRE